MSPRRIQVAIVVGAALLVAGVVWAARSGTPSNSPSSVHVQALEQNAPLATGTLDAAGTADGATGSAAEDGGGAAQSDGGVAGSDGGDPPGSDGTSRVEDGIRFGLVVEARGGDSPALVIDLATLLPADENADPASAEITLYNETRDLLEVPIGDAAVIESETGGAVQLAEWYASVAVRLAEDRDVGVWVTIAGGKATRIEEQELP